MKYILPLLLLCFNLSAQTDSIGLSKIGNQFYVEKFQFNTNVIQSTKTAYGDSVSTGYALTQETLAKFGSYANDARVVSSFRSEVTAWLRFLNKADKQIGNPLDTLVLLNRKLFTTPGWQEFTSRKDKIDFTFRVNVTANGKVNFRWSTDKITFKQAVCLGSIIRLYQFNGENFLDVYNFGNGIWSNINRTVVLLEPNVSSSVLNGFFDKQNQEVSLMSNVTYNADGTVTEVVNGISKTFQYNKTTKL